MSIDNRLSAVADVQRTLLDEGISSFLVDGGLLGVIRDGELIPWDWDIEIAFDNTFADLNSFERAVNSLLKKGYKVKSISRKKFFKINLFLPNEPSFIYSVLGLRNQGKYFVRPRYRYPAVHFTSKATSIINKEKVLFIPRDPESLLEFVYGENWKVPIESTKPKQYLDFKVFRWGSFDVFYRLFNKLNSLSSFFRKLIVSQALNGREFLFHLLLRAETSPRCKLLEIGSSDGLESKSFLERDNKRFSIIYEPRDIAHRSILKNNRKHFSNSRISLNKKVVVAKSGDSVNFMIENSENLSHISPNLTSYLGGDEKPVFDEISLHEILKLHTGDPLFIKMDLEGYEIPIIRSFNEISGSIGTSAILIELHQDEYVDSEAKQAFYELLNLGFIISHLETASHPKPRVLTKYLKDQPLAISGRRGLWQIDTNDSRELIPFLTEKYFVYNDFLAEFGFRVIRSVLLTKGVNFSVKNQSFRSKFLKLMYGI